MFKNILVAMDGSERSYKALDVALDLQRRYESDLTLLTVFRHHSLLEASMSMVRPQEPETMDDALRSYAVEVSEAAKKYAIEGGAENVRAFVKRGPPSRTIVAFGEEHGADMIVLGSRGHGDLENYLLGSVSHKVTSLADCPVLVV
jgi:nucleotide-binding universal stress UspA family protein